jgi:ATP-dependent RNA helicase SUPV3L1/SUV3
MEEVEIEVWWPKDTGPFRHRADRQREQNRAPQPRREGTAKTAEAGEKAEGEQRRRPPRYGKGPRREDRPEAAEGRPERHGRKPQREDRKPAFEERKPRPEKPIDPDSPFAVLGALKAKLAGK